MIARLVPEKGFAEAPAECRTVADSMRWAEDALLRVSSHLGHATVAGMLSERHIRFSGAFEGISAAGTASAIVAAAAARMVRSSSSTAIPLVLQPTWVIEVNKVAQDELAMLPEPPHCIFGDIGQFCPPKLRRAFGYDGGDEQPAHVLRTLIPNCTPLLRGHCVRHGRTCSLFRTELHTCGSHCTAHSSFGQRQGFGDASRVKFFYIWIALIRTLRIPVVLHENVEAFGLDEMSVLLSDMYFLARMVENSSELGWAIERKRQCILAVLRCWSVRVIMHESCRQGPPVSFTEAESAALVAKGLRDYQGELSGLFRRACLYSYHSYLVATPEEISEEVAWLQSRRSVHERAQARAMGLDKFENDPPGTALRDNYSIAERERYAGYDKFFPKALLDSSVRRATRETEVPSTPGHPLVLALTRGRRHLGIRRLIVCSGVVVPGPPWALRLFVLLG